MESHIRPAKRKHSEGSFNGDKNAKKPRLQVTLCKFQVSQEQLKKLRRRKLSTKHENTTNKEKEKENENSAEANNKDAPGLSSQIVRESPVRHRLSNLLDGSVPSPGHDRTTLSDDEDENVLSINCEYEQLNTAKSLSNPDSVKAHLFEPNENSIDDFLPLMGDEPCITVPCFLEDVTETCLQVDAPLNETCSASDKLTTDAGAACAWENCGNGGTDQRHDEKHSSKDDSVLSVPEQEEASINSCDATVIDFHSGVFVPRNEPAVPGVVDGEARMESEPGGDSGCGSMSSSAEDNSIDYASSYNTLEVMNTLLSDLNEERSRRVELEERISNMEDKNNNLLAESHKLKEVVNDLLHLSKVKAEETVSRGTQINMNISLRRGRTVDRATSPLRTRDPSPDLHEGVHKKPMTSTLSQTDEEVIPPKILVSIASQTDLYMTQIRAAPRSAFPTQVHPMVMPNVQATAPAHLQSATQISTSQPSTGAQYTQIPPTNVNEGPSMLGRQTSNNQALPHSTLNAYINAYNAIPQRHSTICSPQTGGQAPQTSYLSRAQSNRQAQHVARQYYSAHQQTNPTRPLQQIADPRAAVQSRISAVIDETNRLNQLRHQHAQRVARQYYSAQQQTNPTRTLQQIADSRAAVQSRTSAAIDETNRVNQIRHQHATATGQSTRNSGQRLGNVSSSRVAYQQRISPPFPLAMCTQPPVSQPETQVHTQLRIQGNSVFMSQSQQGATLNSSTNQSVALGRTMQQSVPQSLAIHSPLQGHRNPALMSQNHQRVNLNTSVDQSATCAVTLQQSASQPVAVNAQLYTQINPVSVSPILQASNLNLPINHTSVAEVAVQQSAHSPPVPASVQTRSSNRYNDTMAQLRQTAVERNVAVSKKEQRAQSSAQDLSLYDEVQRIYGELQQSLDEITANKQKQRNVDVASSESVTVDSVPVNTTPPYDSSSEVTTKHMTSSNLSCHSSSIIVTASEGPSSSQACNSDETDSNRSTSSPSLQSAVDVLQQDSSKEQITNVSRNKDPYRKPAKAPSGALEDAVQRLVSLQNNTTSSQNNSRCTTPDSVADLFEGTSKDNSMDSLQSEPETSNGRGVSLSESQPKNTSTQDCSRISEPGTVKAVSLVQYSHNVVDHCQVNPPESISNSPVEIEVDERQSVSEKTSLCEEDIQETGGSLITEEDVEKMGGITDGCTEDRTASNSDSLFIAPSTPVKTKDENEKDKDDLYMFLMSPIIPPIAIPKRVWPRIPQFNCDDVDVTVQNSKNEYQGSEATVQNTDSTDQDDENDPKQTQIVNETEGTVKYKGDADPDPEKLENGPEFTQSVLETKASQDDDGNVDEDQVTVGQPKQGIDERQQAVTNTNNADPNVDNGLEVVQSVVGTDEPVEDGDNADEDMETDAELQQAETNVDNADPGRGNYPELALHAVEAEESVEDGDNADEDKEDDAEPKQSIAETQPAEMDVDNADPGRENYPELVLHTVEAVESVEDGDDADEGKEADGEPRRSIAEKQQAETNTEIAGPSVENDPEFIQSAVETEEFMERRDNADEDMETNTEPTRSVVETQQAMIDAENVDHYAEDDPEFTPRVEEELADDGANADEDMEGDTKPGQVIAETQQADVDYADLDIEKEATLAMNALDAEETVADTENTETDQTTVITQHGSGSLYSTEYCANRDSNQQENRNTEGSEHSTEDQVPVVLPFRSEATIQDKENLQAVSRSYFPTGLHVNGEDIAGVVVASNVNVDQNEKDNAATDDVSQQQVNGASFLPVPRLAVRLVNNDLVLMWDLPPDSKVTEIEYFELYSWSRSSGQWLSIAKIKPLRPPMGCTVRNLSPGKMFFSVRAVSRNGVTGQFSRPSGISYSSNVYS